MAFKRLKWYRNTGLMLLALLWLLTGCGDDDTGTTPVQFYNNPLDASIVTSDIPLFWKTFDAAGNSFTAEVFKKDYFDVGTEALALFFEQKIKNASKLSNNLNSPGVRDYYLGIRENTENLEAATDDIYAGFSQLKQLYEEAVFSDIVFVIGALSTGGTVVKNGQMVIGTEMFAIDDNTPLDGLNSWQRSVVRNRTFLPSIVIHELVHVQQMRIANERGSSILTGRTLLDLSLAEGSADFITDLVLGEFFNDFIHDYADPIEQDLWREFEPEMSNTNTTRWLYNGANAGNRPGDLGYYVGYKIAEHFYNQSGDKTAAIKSILEIQNGQDFLVLSGYASKFD
ncbi:DUF2268 domain-containing putative Zn-dependent protease [Fulvivirgaceae bacterium BMA12]|uniref:DUF2268 domain-containing putative Zn-dependent protease n=1 Tax=Agaribacillus aureus TaxID=3051825 RepID=A0ABT8LBG5_9BACT|nr:DUF2268 domain-containing putative Zn-dependent protease [Fulvivirgaceae bacterium BMA12]